MKAALLRRLLEEPEKSVRYGVAGVVATISKLEVPAGKWNELLQFLLQGTQDQNPRHRETAMLLFRALAEVIGKHLKPHFHVLQEIFLKGLSDPQSQLVRSESLKALGRLLDNVKTDAEIMSFKKCIPPLIQAFQSILDDNDEFSINTAFEVFDELTTSEVPVINPHIPLLVRFMLSRCVDKNLGILFRSRARNLICLIICSKPKKIAANNLVNEIVKTVIELYVEPFNAEDLEYEDISPTLMAQELIDTLAQYLDPEPIYSSCKQNIVAMLASQDPNFRRGGLCLLGTLAENCGQFMSEELDIWVPRICASIQDLDSDVRESAASALVQFADRLNPEITHYHDQVIPNLVQSFDTCKSPVVMAKTCVALETYVVNLEIPIDSYLHLMIEKLIGVYQHIPLVPLRCAVVSAIASIAHAAKSSFQPYFNLMMPILLELMATEGEQLERMRARAVQCVGDIACAVGKEMFHPYFEPVFLMVKNGFEKENCCEWRECAFGFFSNLAELYKEDLSHFLPIILPFIVAAMDSNEGVKIEDFHEADEIVHGDIGSDSEGEDLETRQNQTSFMQNGFVDEKSAALLALAQIIQQCGVHFFTYWEDLKPHIEELIDFPHHFIRRSVMTCYDQILTASARLYPMKVYWSRGNPGVLSDQCAALLRFIMPQVIFAIDDEDKESAAQALDVVLNIMKLFGLAGVGDELAAKIHPSIISALKEELICQQTIDEEQDEEMTLAHDHYLLEAVVELIDFLGSIVALEDYLKLVRSYVPLLFRFTKKFRAHLDIASAIGSFASMTVHLGPMMAEFAPDILDILLPNVQHEEIQLVHNTAFCIGMFAIHFPELCAPHFPKIIHNLVSMISELSDSANEKVEFPRDNLCSALGKILVVSRQVNSENIAAFVSCLPFKKDYEEAPHAYSALISLFQFAPELMMPHLPHLINVLAVLLFDEKLEIGLRGQLIELTRQLFSQLGHQMNGILSTLSPESQQALMRALQ